MGRWLNVTLESSIIEWSLFDLFELYRELSGEAAPTVIVLPNVRLTIWLSSRIYAALIVQ